LEEILTAKKTATRSISGNKANKFRYKASFSLPYFDFFAFVVDFFFKAYCVKGNFDAEKVK
jgi:hypothetical protein